MPIDKALEDALKHNPKSHEFMRQLENNKAFTDRMEKAGVVTRKQGFSVPLMERIVLSVS